MGCRAGGGQVGPEQVVPAAGSSGRVQGRWLSNRNPVQGSHSFIPPFIPPSIEAASKILAELRVCKGTGLGSGTKAMGEKGRSSP